MGITKTDIMTYSDYKKQAERLSQLLQMQHENGLTNEQEVELEQIANAIKPYAF